jgi:hypothetical protein
VSESAAALTASIKMALWRERPDVMVRELFGVVPDVWQDEVLRDFPHCPRQAMQACKGPGKTAVESWLSWNFLLTRPHPKIAAISISGENLRDNLWSEMAYWQAKAPLLQEMFAWSAKRIVCKAAPETWWMSARTWQKTADKEQQANTLAGLHAPYVMIVMDESGGIPDAVGATADAIFSGATEAHIVQAGNPTHLSGPLYRAATIDAAMWKVYRITGDPDSPKRSPRVPLEWARAQIRSYGRDNPWVLVNVFGEFPPSSINALLGPDDIDRVMGLHVPKSAYDKAARVLGVDVARYGDDASVIFPRQGVAAFTPQVMRNLDSLQGAGHVTRRWEDFFGDNTRVKADACFVDNTGGYGAGWIDQLVSLGRAPIGIGFATKANDPRFFNKRAEMAWDMAEAIKAGLALPESPELRAELTALTYCFKGDRILVIEKDQIRSVLGRSPDWSDALMLTYAQPVQPAWSVERQQIEEQAYDVAAMARAITERADEDRYSR